MDLFKQLKNLKNILPDPGYALRSKSEILHPRILATKFFGFRFRSPQTALATVGLIGVFVFGIVRFASPLNVGTVDPTALKAEAQAIGIQIELTNLSYTEIEAEKISSNSNTESTPAKTTEVKKEKAPEEPSVDESIEKALEELAE